MPRFECDKCGACCNGSLIVEANLIDVLREPRIAQVDQYYSKLGVEKAIELLKEDVGRSLILACGDACPFLRDSLCSIHPTRPNVCVGFEAGDEQCQEARLLQGLPPLEPLA